MIPWRALLMYRCASHTDTPLVCRFWSCESIMRTGDPARRILVRVSLFLLTLHPTRYPLDVVKTRVQLQTGTGASAEYNGMVDCFRKIIKHEGCVFLWAHILLFLPASLTIVVSRDSIAESRRPFSWRRRSEPPSLLPTTSGARFIARCLACPR